VYAKLTSAIVVVVSDEIEFISISLNDTGKIF
jgi:hypothetical protein